MKSGFLVLIIISLAHYTSQVTTSSIEPNNASTIYPLVELDEGAKIIRFWKSLQDDRNTYPTLPYDVDSCYGWIGKDRPMKGQFIGLALTPNCYIVKADLINFVDTYQKANAEYDRYSEDEHAMRSQCKHHHLFIARLHRLDEGGLFSYHYTRVRMMGNKVQVTFFALKDVLEEGKYYHASNVYEHPSVKFYNADVFPNSFVPFVVYTIDYEIYVWFKSKEGLRLYNYRLTWDSTNTDNGYHVDVYQRFAVPQAIVPSNRVSYIVTSNEEMHYFFVQTQDNNLHDVFMIKHTDLISADFTRMDVLTTNMPVDVYPRNIIGKVMPFYSLAVYHKSIRFNKLCTNGAHVEFYSNLTLKDGKLKSLVPNITDPPLALNIYASHFRSAYPFVTNGRNIKRPQYYKMIVPISLAIVAALVARWVIIGYSVLPTRLGRWIRLRSSRRHYIFKSLAAKGDSQFIPLFTVLYGMEKWVRKWSKRLFKTVGWLLQIETNDEDEETRLLLQTVYTQDAPSQRDASTPNE